jgi:acetylornithine deacetylase/succinyl-diaminopimelate desuccinylase-like protein
VIRCFSASLLALSVALSAAPAVAAPDQVLARQLLDDLIASNTAPSGGPDTRHAVGLLVDALRAAGFPEADIHVVGISDELPSLVVRFRSPDPQAGAVLMMAHIDVVEGLASDWSYPPYQATEEDGWIYGRGSTDNKAGVAMLVANFIQLHREGFRPDRDLILMLTADEETNGFSANMLGTTHRDLIAADFALNTDGGGVIEGPDGAPLAFVMQTAEKVYATYALTASDPGGHSSLPKPDSPISAVSRALVALEDYHFPINLNEISRGFFANWSVVAPQEDRALLEAMAAWQPGEPEPDGLAASPYYNSLARTTCVATGLAGGHAENALPQTARAVVNCRILPQETAESVEERLRALAAPYGVNVENTFPYMASPPSLPRDDVTGPVTELAVRHFGQIPVIPELSTGATDGAFIRNAGIPVYGVSAISEDPSDVRAHGMNERIRISAYEDSVEYWYDLAKAVATLD